MHRTRPFHAYGNQSSKVAGDILEKVATGLQLYLPTASHQTIVCSELFLVWLLDCCVAVHPHISGPAESPVSSAQHSWYM
jgi:hypothetical protein